MRSITVVPKPPKIVNKPTNVTVKPVTLTCHVEGDPAHYWVGWMYCTENLLLKKENTMPCLPLQASMVHLTI